MNRLLAPTALLVLALTSAGCSKSEGSAPAPAVPPGQTRVVADEHGFKPSSIKLEKGKPATLSFLRTTDETCAKQVAFPDLKLTKDLPLNQPVAIEVPTGEARTLTFQCGMGMYKSTVVVQ